MHRPSPTACLLRGYGRAGARNDCLGFFIICFIYFLKRSNSMHTSPFAHLYPISVHMSVSHVCAHVCAHVCTPCLCPCLRTCLYPMSIHTVRTQILSDDSTDPEITVKVAAGQAEWGPLFLPDLGACLLAKRQWARRGSEGGNRRPLDMTHDWACRGSIPAIADGMSIARYSR